MRQGLEWEKNDLIEEQMKETVRGRHTLAGRWRTYTEENETIAKIKIITQPIVHTATCHILHIVSDSLGAVCINASLPLSVSVYIFSILSLLPAASFDHTRLSRRALFCLSGHMLNHTHTHPLVYPHPARQTFDSTSACRVFSVNC